MDWKLKCLAGVLAPVLLTTTAAAQSATVSTAKSKRFEAHLTDAKGRALYVFTADTQGQKGKTAQSACYEICAEAWPPFFTKGEPKVSGSADESLTGTIKRKDGRIQVTYDGRPLYYFTRDVGYEQPNGHDSEAYGGEWYLVAPDGEQLPARSD